LAVPVILMLPVTAVVEERQRAGVTGLRAAG
jgi:hypothetical protein